MSVHSSNRSGASGAHRSQASDHNNNLSGSAAPINQEAIHHAHTHTGGSTLHGIPNVATVADDDNEVNHNSSAFAALN